MSGTYCRAILNNAIFGCIGPEGVEYRKYGIILQGAALQIIYFPSLSCDSSSSPALPLRFIKNVAPHRPQNHGQIVLLGLRRY